MPAGLHHLLGDAGPKRWPNLNRKADGGKPVINKGVEMKTSPFISEISNSEDTAGTITKQPHNRPSKSAIRQNCKRQMRQLRQEARLISDKETRTQISRIIRSSLVAIDEDYELEELFEMAESQLDFVRWAVSSELASNPVQQRSEKPKKPRTHSAISMERKKQRSALQAQSRTLISAAKTSFKKQMGEFAKQASLIENEKLRTDILKLIGSLVGSLRQYRKWDELFEFVESNTDIVGIGIAIGLYGLGDPRTQKLCDLGEARAMDRAMMANQRDN